jgi:hypothetical protein
MFIPDLRSRIRIFFQSRIQGSKITEFRILGIARCYVVSTNTLEVPIPVHQVPVPVYQVGYLCKFTYNHINLHTIIISAWQQPQDVFVTCVLSSFEKYCFNLPGVKNRRKMSVCV